MVEFHEVFSKVLDEFVGVWADLQTEVIHNAFQSMNKNLEIILFHQLHIDFQDSFQKGLNQILHSFVPQQTVKRLSCFYPNQGLWIRC